MKFLFILLSIALGTINFSYADINSTPNYEIQQCSACSSGSGGCYSDANRRAGRVCLPHTIDEVSGIPYCPIGFTSCGVREIGPNSSEETCPNCPAGTEGSANYTLEIEMGGFRDGIYVCEVGFNAHKCLDKGRDPKGDHIVIGSGSEKVVITADTNNPTQFSFEDAQSGGTAKVYLNSANYGAAYYVKYCYDYTKVVVGDAEYLSGVELLGNLSGSVTLNVGDTGGYYNHAGVTGNISVQCSDAAAEVTPIALDDNLSQEVSFFHVFNLNGPVNTPLLDGCRFTIEFEETKRSFVRQLKDDNSTYSATVNTGVNYVMELLY